MERPSYVAALSVPFLRQAMIEVTEDKVDAGHMADVQIERYFPHRRFTDLDTFTCCATGANKTTVHSVLGARNVPRYMQHGHSHNSTSC